MSQAAWDRSTMGGAGPGAAHRRMLGAAAIALAAGFVSGAMLAQPQAAAPASAACRAGDAWHAWHAWHDPERSPLSRGAEVRLP
jgi:hypothetical protein